MQRTTASARRRTGTSTSRPPGVADDPIAGPPGVMVLGALRSGIGMLAAVLERMGLQRCLEAPGLPPPDSDLPLALGGPDGDLNDRMLASLGWTWDAPDVQPLGPWPDSAGLVAEARDVAGRSLRPAGRWFVADARLSLLLPYWRQALFDRFVTLLVVRDPMEAAWSLAMRGIGPTELGLALWSTYHRHVVRGLAGMPVVVVDHAALMDDPVPVVLRLGEELARHGVRPPLDARSAAAVVDRTLRRTTYPPDATRASTLLRSACVQHRRLATDPVTSHPRFQLEALPATAWERALLGGRRTVSTTLRAVAAELSETTEELAVERARADATQRELDALERTLASFEVLADRHRAAVSGMEELVGAVEARARVEHDRADALAHELASAGSRLVAAEQARGGHADLLAAASSTQLGRINRRWLRMRASHPVLVRWFVRPFEVLWRVMTLRHPWWLREHPLFDARWYAEANPDISRGRLPPWWHYVRHGSREGRRPNAYFDVAWYLQSYPDVEASRVRALDHYLLRGAWEGRDPGPGFQSRWYLHEYPDVAAAGINPLMHFLRLGRTEGRRPGPEQEARPSVAPEVQPTRDPAGLTGPPTLGEVGPLPRDTSPPQPVAAFDVDAEVLGSLPPGVRIGALLDRDGLVPDVGVRDLETVPQDAQGDLDLDPASDERAAIAHLEALRQTRIDYLVAPPSAPWLETVPGLARHLRTHYELLPTRPGSVPIYDLTTPSGASDTPDPRLVEAIRLAAARSSTRPTVLDWQSSIPHLERLEHGLVLASPKGNGQILPYEDAAIDIVLVNGAGPRVLAEARRVARRLIVQKVGDDPTDLSLRWLDGQAPPSVSVVVPAGRDGAALAACLRSLAETLAPVVDAEVVVVGGRRNMAGASPESPFLDGAGLDDRDGPARLRVRTTRRGTRMGFAAAVRAGVQEAVNELVVILHPDTVALEGWLEAARSRFVEQPQSGVVGAMLLDPDGRLQEAGGSAYSDGDLVRIGEGDPHPSDARYQVPRQVDFVSSACLVTPRALFVELGGLDEAFPPGPFQSADYCLRVRRRSRDVWYEPGSMLVHADRAPGCPDAVTRTSSRRDDPRATFLARWSGQLGQWPGDEAEDPGPRSRSREGAGARASS